MAVGTVAFTNYEKEDVVWPFTWSDASYPDLTAIVGLALQLVVKQTAAAADPPLLGPITCAVTGATSFTATLNLNLAAGTYVYSVRRTDAGHSWQVAQGTLTLLESASV